MRCEKCAFENAPGVRFCGRCGSPLAEAPTTCPNCRSVNAPGLKFCGNCGTGLAPTARTAQEPKVQPMTVPADYRGNPPGSSSSAPPPRRTSSSGNRIPLIVGGVLVAACLLFACVGAAVAAVGGGGVNVLGLAPATSTTVPTPRINGNQPTATPASNQGGSATPAPPAATPTPVPPANEPLKAEYLKGDGPTVNGMKLVLTDSKADIGSIFSQRAAFNATYTFQNTTQQPISLNLPNNAFTIEVLTDKFDANSISPNTPTVGPGETATIAVGFQVTGGLQKFMSVKDIFIIANSVGPVSGAKWKVSFQN